eukprot:1160997-Pelagomonas_calceolata.AAC.1
MQVKANVVALNEAAERITHKLQAALGRMGNQEATTGSCAVRPEERIRANSQVCAFLCQPVSSANQPRQPRHPSVSDCSEMLAGWGLGKMDVLFVRLHLQC